MAERIPWFRVTVEGFVIVVSILLAFGIDAWWEERGRRAHESTYLAIVAEDARQEIQGLEAILRLLANNQRAASRVLPFLESGKPISDDTLSFVADLFQPTRLPIPVISGAGLSEGRRDADRLALIRDLRLRDEVSSYFDGAARVQLMYDLQPEGYRQTVRSAMPFELGTLLRDGCQLGPAEPAPCHPDSGPQDWSWDFLTDLQGGRELAGDLRYLMTQQLQSLRFVRSQIAASTSVLEALGS